MVLLNDVPLAVVMLVPVALLTDVLLDALLVLLVDVRVAVPLNVALLAVAMPVPVALLTGVLLDALLV